MKQFLLHILCLVCICLVVANCKHKPDIDPSGTSCGEATTIDEMMEWVYFKTGTFWVYREESSGELDTMSVFESTEGEAGGFRMFSYSMKSSYDHFNYTYWFSASYCQNCLFDNVCRGYKITSSKWIPGDVIGQGNAFVFPLKEGYKVYADCSQIEYGANTEIVAYPQDVQAPIQLFENCAKFNLACGPQSNWQPMNYYLCQYVGIVRKELLESNEIWELIEFHIEP